MLSSFAMIQILGWQVDFHLGKLDLGLLVWMDELKGIFKLYTAEVNTVLFVLTSPGLDSLLCANYYGDQRHNQTTRPVRRKQDTRT